jgi:uncharacterized protein YndB with AHSA1/START domain
MAQKEDRALPQELTVTRLLKAPIDLVWQIWTDAAHVKEWWGPFGFTSPVCHWNPKVGNRIRIDMKGPDGRIVPAEGEFVEVTPPTRLVFKTHKMGNDGKPEVTLLNTMILAREGRQTRFELQIKVLLVTDAGKPALAGLNVGLNQQLDKMEAHLATANNE